MTMPQSIGGEDYGVAAISLISAPDPIASHLVSTQGQAGRSSMGRKPSYLLSKIQADLCGKSARVNSAAAFGAVESSMTHIFGYDRAEAQVKADTNSISE